jgi:hypothetical protein
LDALEAVGAGWEARVITDCRLCGAPHALLVTRSGGRLSLVCAGDEYGRELGFESACSIDGFRWALGYQTALERPAGVDELAAVIRRRREERR